jgi:hypothetical protein
MRLVPPEIRSGSRRAAKTMRDPSGEMSKASTLNWSPRVI